MQTVILGNGIIALSTAFRLAARSGPDDRVTIVGPADRTGAATLAAAAMLNSFAEVETDSLESDLDRYRFELSRQAGRAWQEFDRQIGEAIPTEDACSLAPDLTFGTYVINNTAADDLDDENFDAIVRALDSYGEPFSLISPGEVPNYRPAQRHRATRAVMIPNEGWLNPRLLLARLEAALGSFPQVERLDSRAIRFNFDGSGISGVELSSGGTLEGDTYLLATGATATDLIAASHLDLPIQRVFYGVGVSIEVRSPDAPHKNCVRTPNRGLACGVYSAPYSAGAGPVTDHVLIGASNFISPVPYHHGRLTSVATLMQAAIEQINSDFYRADLLRVNVGWRPTSQDTYPLIGTTSVPNLIVATGTKRDGLHLSPVLSQIIAAMILGEAVDERFAVFAPERTPIRALTRVKAVEKAVRHLVSASYQHGFSPAHDRMPDRVRRMFRDDVERVHDQVGAHDWGIPPEMLDMYRYGHATPK